MMKSFTLLLLFVPCVSSFIANTKAVTTTGLVQQQVRSFPAPTPLFLHVQQMHDHRDTLVKLDDPIIGERGSYKKKESLHSFTNHLAPIVLALYLVGHYLKPYHVPLTDERVNIDPMFGGGILIGVGLYLLKSSIDTNFLSWVLFGRFSSS
mmetsp:Transcript_55526/g.82549  ORF Transcript_55526/g.82549 Transcript_55526/m.82549 type:complete len:151 (-) Transcript_55526:864-1316(-)